MEKVMEILDMEIKAVKEKTKTVSIKNESLKLRLFFLLVNHVLNNCNYDLAQLLESLKKAS